MSGVNKNKEDNHHKLNTTTEDGASHTFKKLQKQKTAIIKDPIMHWVHLFAGLYILGFCVLIVFLIFQVIGNQFIYISSYTWIFIIGTFTIYGFLLSIFELIVYFQDSGITNNHKTQLLTFIIDHVFVTLQFLIIFGIAFYVNNLNTVTNVNEYNSDRNWLSLWMFIVIFILFKSTLISVVAVK